MNPSACNLQVGSPQLHADAEPAHVSATGLAMQQIELKYSVLQHSWQQGCLMQANIYQSHPASHTASLCTSVHMQERLTELCPDLTLQSDQHVVE